MIVAGSQGVSVIRRPSHLASSAPLGEDLISDSLSASWLSGVCCRHTIHIQFNRESVRKMLLLRICFRWGSGSQSLTQDSNA